MPILIIGNLAVLLCGLAFSLINFGGINLTASKLSQPESK